MLEKRRRQNEKDTIKSKPLKVMKNWDGPCLPLRTEGKSCSTCVTSTVVYNWLRMCTKIAYCVVKAHSKKKLTEQRDSKEMTYYFKKNKAKVSPFINKINSTDKK